MSSQSLRIPSKHDILRWLAKHNWFIRLLAFKCSHDVKKFNEVVRSEKNIVILALKETRFREDLEILDLEPGMRVLRVPEAWLGTFYRWFYGFNNCHDAVERVDVKNQQDNYRAFLSEFLPRLVERLEVDVAVGSGSNYKTIIDWGAVLHQMGVAYLVFHREGFMGSPHEENQIRSWGINGRRFEGTRLLLQTEVMRKLLVESKFVEESRSGMAGCIRMDRLIFSDHADYRERGHKGQEKWVTLFSFGVATGFFANYWPKGWENGGYLFRTCCLTHTVVAQFAIDNPDVNVMIKLKWGGKWLSEVTWILRQAGIEPRDVPNLYLCSSIDAQRQAQRSAVVIGYGSTTLLESAILGLPVIVPNFGEVASPSYGKFVTFPDIKDCFDLASCPSELTALIKDRLINSSIAETVMAKRRDAFQRYLSFTDRKSIDEYLRLFEDAAHYTGKIRKKNS